MEQNQTTSQSNAQLKPQVVIAKSPKSTGIALILTFLFGPLGLLYASLLGGLIMLIVAIPVVIFTLVIGYIFIILPICLIWAAIAVNNHNKKLEKGKYVES